MSIVEPVQSQNNDSVNLNQDFPANLVSQTTSNILKSGNWKSAGHPTSGNVRLLEKEGQYYLEFNQNFKTDQGPALYVILHKSDDLIATTSAPNHALQEGEYEIVAPLTKVKGSQSYALPENINPDNYQSVAIWCEKFNVTFGAASLN